MTVKQQQPPPIAIVGIGLRLSGGVSTPDDFWQMLINKQSGHCRVPSDRYNVEAYHDERLRRHVATDSGYFLRDTNLKSFDAGFFSMAATEVQHLDPQQRLLLEVTWECMEGAGQTNWRGKDIGCYVGSFGEDWHNITGRDAELSGVWCTPGAGDFALSNRISYEYDLKGPSMTIRTACSASLVCLHEAVQALYNGNCSGAIVGGVSVIMDPTMTLNMSEQGVLASDGICKTFDSAADGFARGEAAAVIFIKPLADALRDGDPVRAIIRGTSVNSDGKTIGLSNPSPDAQEQLIRKAYRAAGISDDGLSATPYIECHGTGTQTGDAIETAAIANAFAGDELKYICSVKPNVGHTEGASGVVSIIKAALALENEIIPPNIHFSQPNPKIPFKEGNLEVPVEPTPWPQDRPVRASVNSFGIGGSNAHVVLESAAAHGFNSSGAHCNRVRHVNKDSVAHVDDKAGQTNGHVNGHVNGYGSNGTNGKAPQSLNGSTHATKLPRLLVVSAYDEDSLRGRVKDLRSYVESGHESLDALAHTLGRHRDHLSRRTFCLATEDKISDFESFQKANTNDPKLVFVFTGQGAQWAGMGRELMEQCPSFLEDIRHMDSILQTLDDRPSWTMEDMLCSSTTETEELLKKAEYSQPLCIAIQVALTNFLAKCGVEPDAIVGHSGGETAGAYAAKALTAAEAILVAYYRGLVTKLQTRRGAMAAVGLGSEATAPYLADGVVVACENSPKGVTISGDEEAVEKTLKAIEASDSETFTRRLQVEMAYHSYHMREIGGEYENLLRPHLTTAHGTVPFYSSVNNEIMFSFSPAYWRTNLESPVLFSASAQHVIQDMPGATFLEIGPHAALKGPLRQIFQHCQSKSVYFPTLVRGENSATNLVTAVGRLFAHGYKIDLSLINPTHASVLTDLPNYSWNHSTEYWIENRISQAWRMPKHPHHELLGSRCLESTDLEPSWRNVLQKSDILWLNDHQIGADVIYPCTAYIAMIGEAIRQISDSDIYVLRNMILKTAMFIQSSDKIEIVTSMKQARLTDYDNSTWFDISVSSCTNSTWTLHCVVQGKAGNEQMFSGTTTTAVKPYIRQVTERSWYTRMKYLGLNFGPNFQSMKQITSHTSEPAATTRIQNDTNEHRSRYSVHPIALDACLQLLGVAASRGVARHLTVMAIPMAIDHICVRPGGPELTAEAKAGLNAKGDVKGNVKVVTDTNDVVVSIENATLMPLDAVDQRKALDALGAARLQWRPDIDFLSKENLITKGTASLPDRFFLEKITAVAILNILDALESVQIQPGYLEKYVYWLNLEKNKMLEGEWASTVPEAQKWARLDAQGHDLLRKALQSEKAAFTENVIKICQLYETISELNNVISMFQGEMNPLELLMEGDALTLIYNDSAESIDDSNFCSLLAHSHPNMKVLEIGAGTGGVTSRVLGALGSNGANMYSEYTFTDISAGFFSAAKERFQDYSGMIFKTLDISKSPAEQGFEIGSYDLIVASNVLHATPSLHATLGNVRSLLRPGGHLILQELSQPLIWRCIPVIMGLTPDWWAGEHDGREDMPTASVDRWDKELRAAGFSGVDVVQADEKAPFAMDQLMLSQAMQSPAVVARAITILYLNEKHEFAEKLATQLEEAKFRVSWVKLGDERHIPDQDVISTIDLETPFISAIQSEEYASFMNYLTGLEVGMLWLTRPAQMHCKDPRYGFIHGLARTLRSERLLDFSTVELEVLDKSSVEAVVKILGKFQDRSDLQELKTEPEYAIHGGVIHVSRYYPVSTVTALESELASDDWKQLIVGTRGLIDSLHWVKSKPIPVGDDDVEVEIHHVGLNFRDVLLTMGIIDGPKNQAGLEASGIVTRIGSAVSNVQVGDHVITLGKELFATRKVIPSGRVVRIPDDLGLEDAATMITVFTTVIYSLITKGQLQKGQSVLIHSACGGVGLAAIQICKMIGAEIYVTVGSEEKIQYLMSNYDIPRERIFNSRDESFHPDVMSATNGRGVDLVLNSLAGELLHASWQCVARCGKMLEIGKRDFYGRGSLRLDPFEGNREFYGIDLLLLLIERPQEVQTIIDQFLEFYRRGFIWPINLAASFAASQVVDAFRYMQKGKHIGKIIINMKDVANLPATAERIVASFSAQGTYLLTGGLGGLGKAITRWMAEHGANNFVFLSRSAGQSEEDQCFIRELEAEGCKAIPVMGSVVEPADVEKAVKSAPTAIKGVLHLSMVLRDNNIADISYDDWKDVVGPKATGAWNLHHALSNADNIDFFVLFGSASAVRGTPGQANYAAANAFFQSFVQYRQGLGLPCSVIDLGPVDGCGFVSESQSIRRKLQAAGLQALQEQELLNALLISINNSFAPKKATESQDRYCCHGQLSTNVQVRTGTTDLMTHDIRLYSCQQMASGNIESSGTASGPLRDFMASVPGNPEVLNQVESLSLLTAEIRRVICNFMMMNEDDTDINTPLKSLGIDSLIGLEIRSWWRKNLGIDITALNIAKADTIQKLGNLAIALLKEKYGAKSVPGSTGELAQQTEVDVDIAAEYLSRVNTTWELEEFASNPVTQLPHQATVFLSGATGYLGTEILKELVRHDTIGNVVALVRAKSTEQGLDRIKNMAVASGWWEDDDAAKIEVWTGDLTATNMGLDDVHLERLRGLSTTHRNVDAIISNGASVNWVSTFEMMSDSNVDAPVNLLKLALSSPNHPKFIHVSGGLKRDINQPFTEYAEEAKRQIGYLQTKAISESIVMDVVARLPGNQNRISVVRPGLLIGPLVSGLADIDDAIWSGVAACTLLGVCPQYPAGTWMPMATTDQVAARITQQLFDSTKERESWVDLTDGMYIDKFWEIATEELNLRLPTMPLVELLALIAGKLDELETIVPIWSFQGVLATPDLITRFGHGQDNVSLGDAVRKNIQYLRSKGHFINQGS